MIKQLIAFVIIIIVSIVSDRLITKHRLSINQREWNEYSANMTREEKLDVFNEWLAEQQIKHNWPNKYIPKI